MKYRAMSVALAVSLALCPQPVFAADAGNEEGGPAGTTVEDATGTSSSSSGTRTAEDYKAAFGGIKDVWTTILALAAVAGTLAVVGKIGADIAQQQARG
jgi:conserved domain protein